MATQQVPSVGRAVHYVTTTAYGWRESGEHRPAVIVRVWAPGNEHSSVQLQVLTDGLNDGFPADQGTKWASSVSHDETTKNPGTWHWPEYVPAVDVPE